MLLTERERQVLALKANGLTNNQVARRLRIGKTTVDNYLHAARQKFGAANTTQASSIAFALGELNLADIDIPSDSPCTSPSTAAGSSASSAR
jgi:DNA-binding CsgD family transcriptional regulator